MASTFTARRSPGSAPSTYTGPVSGCTRPISTESSSCPVIPGLICRSIASIVSISTVDPRATRTVGAISGCHRLWPLPPWLASGSSGWRWMCASAMAFASRERGCEVSSICNRCARCAGHASAACVSTVAGVRPLPGSPVLRVTDGRGVRMPPGGEPVPSSRSGRWTRMPRNKACPRHWRAPFTDTARAAMPRSVLPPCEDIRGSPGIEAQGTWRLRGFQMTFW